jgi:MFS family permease
MAMNNMVFEFGDAGERPMRIAVVSSVVELSNAIGPLVAGILADRFSYAPIFIISIVCAVAALIMMFTLVTEPRFTNLESIGA